MSAIRKKKNFKGLQLNNEAIAVEESKTPPEIPALELGLEFKLDLRVEDLQNLSEIGSGNGGTVSKVLHIPTKTIMAKKLIRVDAQTNVRKQIIRELQILHDCNHPNIISFYGALIQQGNIALCMEYMDGGSLDSIYKKIGQIPLNVLRSIAADVLNGLIYLYDSHRIIHRDVKPSNILINTQGLVKLCDFGVSGELINSIADTFVGTSAYMSPERIQGQSYSVKSDVWSFGITLLELAFAKFPFPPDGSRLTVFELLEFIVNEPPPTVSEGELSEEFKELVDKCLIKDPTARPSPILLLETSFVKDSSKAKENLENWVKSLVN